MSIDIFEKILQDYNDIVRVQSQIEQLYEQQRELRKLGEELKSMRKELAEPTDAEMVQAGLECGEAIAKDIKDFVNRGGIWHGKD